MIYFRSTYCAFCKIIGMHGFMTFLDLFSNARASSSINHCCWYPSTELQSTAVHLICRCIFSSQLLVKIDENQLARCYFQREKYLTYYRMRGSCYTDYSYLECAHLWGFRVPHIALSCAPNLLEICNE